MDNTKELSKALIDEITILKNLNHPNIIRLLGIWVDPQGTQCIVMEYASAGSLMEYLRSDKGQALTLPEMLKM